MRVWVGALVVVAVAAAFVPEQPAEREVTRLRRHFATVLEELRSRDVSGLSSAQRAARATHIERLRAYAARGVFPRNTDFADQRVPYFIDRDGTRCAMAYLIEESGAGDYVRKVAAKMNNAYVPEIGRDAELGGTLHAWLDANGLTETEAARIQPSYGGGGCCTIPDDPPPPEVTTAYKVGSGTAITGGVATLVLNVSSLKLGMSPRTTGWLGVGTGALGVALGIAALGERDNYATLGVLNGGIGAVALVAGLRSVVSHDAGRRPPTMNTAQRLTLIPWSAGKRGTGVMATLTF
jgi:hypothetical protein